jgi:DsbC/DsbD-like thiol-disulfide interchange protein
LQGGRGGRAPGALPLELRPKPMQEPGEMQRVPFIIRTPVLLAASLALFSAALALPCLAATASESPWIKETYSKVRLVGGPVQHDGASVMVAGVQIRLAEGWKTYWRNPGDSGVPPHFDWSGSKNLKQAEVLYPAPRRFAEADGTAIGYADEVMFPVRITPERPGEPVELKLNLAYGLCKTLCIPNEATLSLELPPQDAAGQSQDPLLGRLIELAPKPVEAGELPALGKLEARLDGARPELVIEALFPAGAYDTDLFIEAGDSFVPVPKASGPPEAGRQRFVVSFLSPAEAAAIKGKPLTLTLVWDGGARETRWTAE